MIPDPQIMEFTPTARKRGRGTEPKKGKEAKEQHHKQHPEMLATNSCP